MGSNEDEAAVSMWQAVGHLVDFFEQMRPSGQMKDFTQHRVVSTSFMPEGTGWETAVAVQGTTWHPVERYGHDESAARAGHARWLAQLDDLTTITELGVPDCQGPHEVRLLEFSDDLTD